MSLDSTLWIEIRAKPAEVQLHLVNTNLFTPLDDVGGFKRVAADGCIVTIFPDVGVHDGPREAGVDVNMRLFFACTESAKSKHWTLATIRAVISLLRGVPGDALLLYSGDSPALLRKRGDVILDKRCGVWRADTEPQVLPFVTLRHTWGEIPVN